MKNWWKEKDFIGYIPETALHQSLSLEDARKKILKDIGVRNG